MVDKYIIVIHRNDSFIKNLKCHISNTFTIIEKIKIQSVQQEIRVNPVACIVIYLEQDIRQNAHFEQLKRRFSHIPCIVVTSFSSMELARYCGSIGIESVLPYEKIDCIDDEITRICTEKQNRANLTELSINKENSAYTTIIREALSVIEKYYLKIINSGEIADLIEINESTLSREFNKFGLPGPKKLLMFLKVNHAIKLMRNRGLNIREISLME